jgi:hypothetical protein
MPAVVDPAITQFVTRVCESAGALPDSIAGLLLKLAARVSRLEQTVETQGAMLEKVRKQPMGGGADLEP